METARTLDHRIIINPTQNADPFFNVSRKSTSKRWVHFLFTKKTYPYFSFLSQLFFAGIFTFLFFYQPNGVWDTFYLTPLGLQIGGVLFVGLALLGLIGTILSLKEMIKALQKKPLKDRELWLGLSNMASLLASLSIMIGSSLFFLATYFPVAFTKMAIGYGVSASFLVGLFPYFLMAGMALLAIGVILQLVDKFKKMERQNEVQPPLTSTQLFLQILPALSKAAIYSGLALCLGFGLIGLMTPGLCMIVGGVGSLFLLGFSVMEHIQDKNNLPKTIESMSTFSDIHRTSADIRPYFPKTVRSVTLQPASPVPSTDIYDINERDEVPSSFLNTSKSETVPDNEKTLSRVNPSRSRPSYPIGFDPISGGIQRSPHLKITTSEMGNQPTDLSEKIQPVVESSEKPPG